jgi:hypothetical protein
MIDDHSGLRVADPSSSSGARRRGTRPPGPHFAISFAIGVCVALVGCASTGVEPDTGSESTGSTLNPTAGPAAPSFSADDAMALDAQGDALEAELMAMSPAEQEAHLAELSTRFELEISRLSGLEAALGGPESAAAALRSAWQPQIAAIRGSIAQPIQLGFRAGTPSAGTADAGEGLFGGSMAIAESSIGAVAGSNDLEPGPPKTTKPDDPLQISASFDKVTIGFETPPSTGAVTTKIKARSEVKPCPGPDGTFTATATVEVETRAGDVGQTGTLDLSVNGQLDDNAQLVSHGHDFRVQWADFAGGKGTFVDVSAGTTADAVVNRTGGDVTPQVITDAYNVGRSYSLYLLDRLLTAAKSGWESGRCVRLTTNASAGPSGLEPGSSAEISAMPRSKVDGTPTGGNVTATLSAGGASVGPATPIPADAEFTYQAPNQANESGTVYLESRSKRGVGKASITFDTARPGYSATYDGGGISITGTVADLAQPFTTEGVFTGGSTTFQYTPSSDRAGSISFNSPCGPGCVLSGSGTYTIVDNRDGTFTMNEAVSSCTTVTAGFSQQTCRDTAHAVLLAPLNS